MAKAKINGKATPITPKQLLAQWLPLRFQFQLAVWNFQTEAGRAAVDVFQQSFDLGRFNSTGELPWKERKRPRPHPILNETGTLKNSIKSEWTKDSKTVRVYTDPSAFGTAARHKGFCYAAIHNDPSGSHTYGASGVPSQQRQFMGYSDVLKKKMNKLVLKIFEKFPK